MVRILHGFRQPVKFYPHSTLAAPTAYSTGDNVGQHKMVYGKANY